MKDLIKTVAQVVGIVAFTSLALLTLDAAFNRAYALNHSGGYEIKLNPLTELICSLNIMDPEYETAILLHGAVIYVRKEDNTVSEIFSISKCEIRLKRDIWN